MKINAVKGFRDILPEESPAWESLEAAAAKLFASYGFREIRIPMMERTELFARAAGETSDIVEKQMYSFVDVDSSSLTLRPEGTASVVRAYVESAMQSREPVSKLCYAGPMFRRERPQKGRYRQFHQIGAEVFGREDPLADAELLIWLADFFAEIGLDSAVIEVNSLGCGECRPGYRERLADWGRAHAAGLCENCQRRVEQNPLRILDCKVDVENTTEAPLMRDHLCVDCARHHGRVLDLVSAEGVTLRANPRMVRGLDYYCRTAFEIVASGLGSQNAVGGGGRYDGLVKQLGGGDVPGVGFALGVERLLLSLNAASAPKAPRLFVAALGDAAEATGLAIAHGLRLQGVGVEIGGGGKSLRSQMKRADKLGAERTLLIGEDELSRGTGTLRHMETKEQIEVGLRADAVADVMLSLRRPAGRDSS